MIRNEMRSSSANSVRKAVSKRSQPLRSSHLKTDRNTKWRSVEAVF